MLPLLLQTEARLKLQGSSEKGKSHGTAYAAKRSRGFAAKNGRRGRSWPSRGEVADLDHNTRVQIIVELVGLKVTKHNGRGPLIWKLAQLKVRPNDCKDTSVAQSKLPKGITTFMDDDEKAQRVTAIELTT
jgi:hypothetical protein